MPRFSGVNHLRAIKALERAGFSRYRNSKHVIMKKGTITIPVPRHNPIDPFTMGSIIQRAGLTAEEFRALL